jgi:microcystin-dependent protein
MALDFPANPVNGQAYGSYIYNSAVGAWQSKEDPATVATVSTVPPASANPGDIWYDSDDGTSYLYYNDGTSAQWVELLSSGLPSLDLKANLSGGNSFTGAQAITSSITTETPLIVNGVTSQTANLQEWRNSTGVAQSLINSSGNVFVGSTQSNYTTTTQLGVKARAAAQIPLSIQAAASQTADLQQWQNSSGTVLADVGPTGIIEAPRFVSTQATGTAPFTVDSTTAVTNLNADLLDGQHGSVYSPAGMVSQFAGSTAPTGWLLCDGSAVSRTTYATLFTAIGTAYGTGNGSTTFNVPNLKGRIPVGRDAADTSFDVIGETGGAKTHTLTTAEIPAHNHPITFSGQTFTPAGGGGYVASSTGGSGAGGPTGQWSYSIGNTGGGGAHNNLQPYVVMNYIIKV